MKYPIPLWVTIPIILGGCAALGTQSRSVTPTGPPVASSPAVARRPTTAPLESRATSEDEALAAVETVVREGLRESFEKLKRSAEVRRLLAGQTRHFDDAFTTDDVVTFYVRDMSMKIPRKSFAGMPPRGIVSGWLHLNLKGYGSFCLWPSEDVFVPGLRKIVDELDQDVLTAAAVEDLRPGWTTQFKAAFTEHFAFSSDYELKRFLYARDFRDASVDRLSVMDLLSTWTLMQIKNLAQVDGAERRVELVKTACWDGIGYGALELNGRYIVELHGLRQPLVFDCSCQAKRGCDAAALQQVMNATVTSICPHGSQTPGTDMLAEARRVRALPHDGQTDDLARALVLCAAQYEDAYEQALELYGTLPQPDWPAKRVRDYDRVLHRQEPD